MAAAAVGREERRAVLQKDSMNFSCCEGAIHQRFLKVTYFIRGTPEVAAD